MDISQLEVFLTVAREGGFSRAADKLYRTQSAVSQAIRKLEVELGEPLFDRSSRDGLLTDAGRVGHLGLPRVADELYQSARRLRIFVATPPGRSLAPVLEILTWPADEVERRLDEQLALV